MANRLYLDTARRYCVDDLPSASLPGARLQNILESLQLGRSVSPLSLVFLQKQGLITLHDFATGSILYDRFRKLALAEQSVRVKTAIAARPISKAEERAEAYARETAMRGKVEQARAIERAPVVWTLVRKLPVAEKIEQARLIKESDPNYIDKIEHQQLLVRYGINTDVKPHLFAQLIDILKRVDAGYRLSKQDFVWLSSAGRDYFTKKLRVAYHRLEAGFFASEFKKAGDPWAAVNASSHYRKCDCAEEADSLLRTANVKRQKSLKLKSALCTTHGGVMRDLKRWNEALQLGEKAHAFKPDDYRPCTLLGAVHIDINNYQLGQDWFEKAVERGARKDDIDQELRNIFFQADTTKRKEMAEFLLHEDPIRYAWVRQKAKAGRG